MSGFTLLEQARDMVKKTRKRVNKVKFLKELSEKLVDRSRDIGSESFLKENHLAKILSF
jgi:hypothetical protein